MGWDRIRGHAGPTGKLKAAIRSGRLAHANLFVGPDGVGKRQCAFELAKALLCEAADTPGEPCDRCPACVQVMAGTHPDCFSAVRRPDANELDVETMRAFAHRLGLKASRGARKVGIVEDADDFNASSANSFLKPLEEPPAGSVLVLLATSLDRQLPTILSRCHVLAFAPLPAADVRAVLADHGVTVPAQQDRLIRLGHGSPGRSLAFQDDEVWAFRDDLIAGLTAARPDSVRLAGLWVAFAETAGKQGPAQRQRAALGLGVLVDLLRTMLPYSFGLGTGGAGDADPAGASPEAARLRPAAEAIGPDGVAARLEACLDADRQLGRYLQVGLVVEALTGKLFPPPTAR